MNFKKRAKSQEPSFQLAPMIDIVFLLLCFFVTTQIFAQWETEIEVKLPTARTGKIPRRLPGEIIINVLDTGDFVVNRRTLDPEGLHRLLEDIVRLFPGQPVLIRADRRTAYEHVVRVLDMCREADIWNISFATSAVEN